LKVRGEWRKLFYASGPPRAESVLKEVGVAWNSAD